MIFRNGRFNIITVQNLVGIFEIFIFPEILSSRDSTIKKRMGTQEDKGPIYNKWILVAVMSLPLRGNKPLPICWLVGNTSVNQAECILETVLVGF